MQTVYDIRSLLIISYYRKILFDSRRKGNNAEMTILKKFNFEIFSEVTNLIQNQVLQLEIPQTGTYPT